MIDQQQLRSYIEQEIPEFTNRVEQSQCRNAYDIVRQLLQFTTSQIIAHNITAAEKCLNLAAQLYEKGNTSVKNAIENVYVYSFSHAFFTDGNTRKKMLELMPNSLYTLYKRQVLNSHL